MAPPHSFLFLSVLLLSGAASVASTIFNVVSFGAIPDVAVDSAQAFQNAWSAACTWPSPVTVYVPDGTFYISEAAFNGPCLSAKVNFTLVGTLVAPQGYSFSHTMWIAFNHVSGVSITGGGLIDGNGQALWNCKLGGGRHCPQGASSLTFNDAYDIRIDGLRSINSQLFHIVFVRSEEVRVRNVHIDAPGDSPNTDGIHLELSNNINITESNISTGDDCISIGHGTAHLRIESVFCGPGHGISIGSLGKGNQDEVDHVTDITVHNVTFSGTTNGVRIKTWGTEVPGLVNNVTFVDLLMYDVQNPIIIDQNYCPHRKACPGQISKIEIRDITYNNIRGTSMTQESIYFDCSAKKPCTGIILQDIKLQYQDQQEKSFCNFASGVTYGSIVPKSCLKEER